MKEINGKSLSLIAKMFTLKVIESKGNVLLIGETGTGKSALLEYLMKSFPADFHDYQCQQQTPESYSREALFVNHDTAVIDASYVSPDCVAPINELVRKCRAEGRRVILSVMVKTDLGVAFNQFQTVIELERLREGEGIAIQFYGDGSNRRVA